MTNEDRIQILQQKIDDLSNTIHASYQQLQLIQAELDKLKHAEFGKRDQVAENDAGTPTVERPGHSLQAWPWLEHFIGLRLMHVVGIIVLVAGISIGVRYAVDRQLISEGLRIILAYGAATGLLLVSFRLQKKYQLFSAILFSGSMASFYFTTYAASVYYYLLPSLAAFLLMVGFTIYTCIKALQYNSQEIAIIGMIGAYAIPFLVSQHEERVSLFFSYIFLINLGVVFLSLKKSWPLMKKIALLVTWLLFLGWGIFKYERDEQTTALVFLFLFYGMSLFAALAFSKKRQEKLKWQEIMEVAIINIAYYVAAIVVIRDNLPALRLRPAFVTGMATILFILLAAGAKFLFRGELLLQRVLSWQAIALLFIFVGLQWDGIRVTFIWLAISILLFAWGVIRKLSWARLASVFVIGLTLLKLLLYDAVTLSPVQRIISYLAIGVLLLLFSFYYQKLGLYRKKEN